MTLAKVAPPPFFFIMKKTFQLKSGIFSQLQSATTHTLGIKYSQTSTYRHLTETDPLLNTPEGVGAYLVQAHFKESFFERGGGLFHLETTTV